MCIIYIFKWTQYVQWGMRTVPGADAPKQRKSSERGQQPFSHRNWTLFLSPIVQYYLCDVRIRLEGNAI